MTVAEKAQERKPFGWFRGWLTTLIVGIIVASSVGPLTFALTLLAYYGPSHSSSPEVSFPTLYIHFTMPIFGTPLLVPAWIYEAYQTLRLLVFIAAPIAAIPITVVYALMRPVARRIRITVWRRVLFGFALGFATNAVELALAGPRDASTGRISLMMTAPTFFPFLQIQASAVVLALIVRPRWLGVRKTVRALPASQSSV